MLRDSATAIQVSTEGGKATYRASTSSIAASANGVFLGLQGSGTKTVKVTRIVFSGVLTTAAIGELAIFRTTGDVSAASGTTTITACKLKSADASATAVCKSYTTSTIGSGQSQIVSTKCMLGSATVLPTQVEFDFGNLPGTEEFTLSGTSEYAQLFLSAGGFTGASFDMTIEWTEE